MDLCDSDVVERFSKYERVVEALNSMRFVVLKDSDTGVEFYIFRGVERDYIVSPCRLCTCRDFVINFLGGRKREPCYHVIGFYIALNENRVQRLSVSTEIASEILFEIVFQGLSNRLRKLLDRI